MSFDTDPREEQDAEMYAAFAAKDKRIAELEEELADDRVRLAACGVAALGNTRESMKDRITKDSPYYSDNYQDVCNAVDKQISYREQIEAMVAKQAKEKSKDDALWHDEIKIRDNYHEWADKLADAISEYFSADVGEHSSSNNPWAEALDVIESAQLAAQAIAAPPAPASDQPERVALSHNQKAAIQEAISVIEGGEDYKGAYLYEKHGDKNVADDLRTFLTAQADHIPVAAKMAKPLCADCGKRNFTDHIHTCAPAAAEDARDDEPYKPDWVNYRQGLADGKADAIEALQAARPYVTSQNQAEGMMDGFGGRKRRPSDADLALIDETIASVKRDGAAGDAKDAARFRALDMYSRRHKTVGYEINIGGSFEWTSLGDFADRQIAIQDAAIAASKGVP